MFTIGKNFPERKGKAFVVGWGQAGNPIGLQNISVVSGSSSHECITNAFGPSSFTQCKFPFEFGTLKMTRCLHTDSPSANDKMCKKTEKYYAFDQGATTSIFTSLNTKQKTGHIN